MKKLLILPLLAFLTGCVTYYYPETALEDGVYYAEDDPSHAVYSGGYVNNAYYPWSSLDYFYLGYYPYSGYGFSAFGGGFSIGISHGYSPWYYPGSYFGYYSPRYASYNHYPYYPARRHYNGNYSHYNGGHYRNRKNDRGSARNHYAGNGHDGRRNRVGEDADRNQQPTDRRSASPVNRHVSTAPSGYSGNQGMVIRNRETQKTGKSRLQPDQSAQAKTTRQAPARPPSGYKRRAPAASVSKVSSGNNKRTRSKSSSFRQWKSSSDNSANHEQRK